MAPISMKLLGIACLVASTGNSMVGAQTSVPSPVPVMDADFVTSTPTSAPTADMAYDYATTAAPTAVTSEGARAADGLFTGRSRIAWAGALGLAVAAGGMLL
eukprot:g17861.t1